MPPQDQEQKKVSPMVWVFFIIALIIDLAKILMFFINLVPVVGPEISFVFSFYLSVVEVVVVFGGLWMIGLYKSEKGLFFNLMATFGVAVIDLVPVADDFPFTSPVVFWMIVKAYTERSKLAGIVTTAVAGAATGGAGLAATEGAKGVAASRAVIAAARADMRAKRSGREKPDALSESA